MKQRSASNLLQMGIVLVVVGIAIKLLLQVAWAISGLSGLLIIAGIVLAVIGLVSPGRR